MSKRDELAEWLQNMIDALDYGANSPNGGEVTADLIIEAACEEMERRQALAVYCDNLTVGDLLDRVKRLLGERV